MKKIVFILFIILIFSGLIFSGNKDYRLYKDINYPDVKKVLDNSTDSDIQEYFKRITGKKIDWVGHILFVEYFDESNDAVYVDLDRPTGNIKKDQPDMIFYINKKMSKRLDPYQTIVFIAEIEGVILFDKRYLIKVKNIYLRGLM